MPFTTEYNHLQSPEGSSAEGTNNVGWLNLKLPGTTGENSTDRSQQVGRESEITTLENLRQHGEGNTLGSVSSRKVIQ